MSSAIAAARVRLAPWARALTPGPRLRRRLIVLAAASLLLTALYMLWLRDSGLVAVKEVRVTGLTGGDAADVRAALERAAKHSTTLHVDRAGIEQVAEAYPAIRALVITPDFPNAMTIRVLEHRPVAVLTLGGRRVAVAADGSVLEGVAAKAKVPAIKIEGGFPSRRVDPGPALDAVRVAGGAPAILTERLTKVERERGRGVVVRMKDGPDLVFGNPAHLAAKWAAAVRVLADRDAAGADYIDVRIPERPAAGGLPVETVAPVAPAGADQPAPQPAPAAPEGPQAPAQAPAQPVPQTPVQATPQPPQQAVPPAGPNTQP